MIKRHKIQDTTLLIQGPIHDNTRKIIEKYSNVFPYIVLSTWSGAEVTDLEKKLNKSPNEISNLKIISNSLPETKNVFNSLNCYYQIVSTLNGLKDSKTKYTLKIRSDEFYSNLDLVVDRFDGDKMLCSNIFFPQIKKKHANYHISDHFFITDTQILKTTFQKLEKYHKNNTDNFNILNDSIPIESRIALFFLSTKTGLDVGYLMKKRVSCLFVYRIMKKYFEIFDIKNLKPYIVKWGHNPTGKTEIEDIREITPQSTGKYISSIYDIKPSLKHILETFLIRL